MFDLCRRLRVYADLYHEHVSVFCVSKQHAITAFQNSCGWELIDV